MATSLIQQFQDALPRTDTRGRFTKADTRVLKGLVDGYSRSADAASRSGGASRPLLHAPEELFGPWAGLPAHVQDHLKGLADGEIRGCMTFHPRGRLWPAAVRAVYTFADTLEGKERWAWLRRSALKWAPRFWFRPRMTRDALVPVLAKLRWRWVPRPSVGDLLAALGKTPRWLMRGFAEGVEVDRRCRGFFYDPDRRVVYGYLLGLDLVPTTNGVVCYEANLNAGISERMRRTFFDTDPIPAGLADFAQERGLGRVIWVGADLTPLDPWFHVQLKEGLEREGVELEVLEDERLSPRNDVPDGVPVPARALFPPHDPPEGTLVVRLRSYRIEPDNLVGNKEVFSNALGPELERKGDDRVSVLPFDVTPGEVRLPDDPGLPNLVYKYPTENKGEGVFFLRARDAEHAVALGRIIDRRTGERGGRFQPFVSSAVLPGRKIYEYRTWVLTTPDGVRYLGARRRETVTPLPVDLPEGIAERRDPFIITGFFGNVSTRADPAEEPHIRDASLAVAEGIQTLLGRTFVVRR
jgi:hypothetical protein